LDKRLLDEDVYALLKMVHSGRLEKSFAWDDWKTADKFYSHPYCNIAIQKLGYAKAIAMADPNKSENYPSQYSTENKSLSLSHLKYRTTSHRFS
jgi:hypothetical protein